MSNLSARTIAKRLESCPAPLLYSIGFVVIGFVAFAPLVIYGKSIINNVDGITQYSRFVVLGHVVRQAFAGLFAGEGFFLPTYDLSMGYGQPMAYSFDPLMYVSALVPAEQTEPLFCAVGIARIWIAGLSFLGLCRVLPVTRNWSVLSALAYSFSSASLNCFLQVWDVNQMIFFPLVVWGALLLLKERRAFVYIASSAGMFLVCGMYFSYMAHFMVAVLAGAYLVVCHCGIKQWGMTVLAFLGSLLVAFAIAAPVTFAQMAILTSIDRVGLDYYVPALYPSRYYQQMVSGFLGMRFGERDWFFGYGGLAFVACALLFSAKGGRTTLVLKILLIAGALVFCVPALGSLTNGMAYAANRWSFGFALLIACIIGVVGTNGLVQSRKQFAVSASILAFYTLLMALLPEARGKEAWLQLAVAWLILLLAFFRCSRLRSDGGSAYLAVNAAIVAVSVVALGVNMFLFLSPMSMAHWQYRLLEQGVAYDRIAAKTPAMLMRQEAGNRLVRYDRSSNHYQDVVTYGLLGPRVLGVYGIDFYNNYYDNLVDSFHRDLGVLDNCMTMVYTTLDQRAALETVLGVGYYVTSADDTLPLPYDAARLPVKSMEGADETTYELYPIEGGASMALVYDGAISASFWDQLTPLERQEALLQGVFLEDAGNSSVVPAFSSYALDWDIAESDGVEVEEDAIVVTHEGASLTLEFEPQPKTELYLFTSGLSLLPDKPIDQYIEGQWEKLSSDEQAAVREATAMWEPVEAFVVTVEADGSKGRASIPTPANHLYGGKDAWLWNVGYSDEGISALTIEFSTSDTYSFDEFSVLAQPMGSLDEAKRELFSTPARSLSYERDSISFYIGGASEGQIAFLSVPYDECWQATINGESAQVEMANKTFMAVRLPEGECKVVFSYHSRLPWRLALGALFALGLFAFWLKASHAKKKQ